MIRSQFYDKVAELVVSHLGECNNGDNTFAGFLTQELRKKSIRPLTEDEQIRVQLAVFDILDGVLKGNPKEWYLQCDYAPNKDFCELLEKCGLQPALAPWKSQLIVTRDPKNPDFLVCHYKFGYGKNLVKFSEI